MKRGWAVVLLGSVLGGALAQIALSSCTTRADAATPSVSDCQNWAAAELALVPPFNGPSDPGVFKSTLVPPGWEPFAGWSQTDLVYVRKCVQ